MKIALFESISAVVESEPSPAFKKKILKVPLSTKWERDLG